MIIDSEQLMFEYENLKQPYHKIQSLVKNKKIYPLRRGLYETDPTVPGYLLANQIHGPSYLSFEFALSFFGMIPERVHTYTSACFGTGKRHKFQNEFGIYTYQDIPKAAFPHLYTLEIVENRGYYIATKEKALCDQLYKISPIRGIKDFEEYLFDGMRIDEDLFDNLDYISLQFVAPLYKSTNLKQLLLLMKKRRNL